MGTKIQEIHGLHYCQCDDPSQALCAACGEDYCQHCGGRLVIVAQPAQPAQPAPDAATPERALGQSAPEPAEDDDGDGAQIRLAREIERDTAATRIRLGAQYCGGCGTRLTAGHCAYGCG